MLKYRVPHGSQCVTSGLIHTGFGSSSIIAHVVHSPPPPPANSFVIGPAVINTHTAVALLGLARDPTVYGNPTLVTLVVKLVEL